MEQIPYCPNKDCKNHQEKLKSKDWYIYFGSFRNENPKADVCFYLILHKT